MSARTYVLDVWLALMFAVANGVYQNSLYGVAAYLPMKYTNAVITGNVSSSLASDALLHTSHIMAHARCKKWGGDR